MIVNISKDKTALIGMDEGSLDESTAAFRISKNDVYLQDKSQKIRFSISDIIKSAILNKGYLIYCQKTPFSFFKVKLTKNGK
jgi:hypothetical protein